MDIPLRVRSGLDVFLENPTVSGAVGLLTNTASLTNDGRTAFQALSEARVNIRALFAPEHGYYGLGAAGESMADSQHGRIPIYSLYGSALAPTSDRLRDLTAVLIDFQDTGTRWYTFLATLHHMLVACQAVGVPVVVLDRPNPQGGLTIEGNLAEPEHFSMVAPAALPVRYGLTMAEAAQWFNREIRAELHVVQMHGWQRHMLFADTGLTWSAPSPNMPHAHTALFYTGTCLIEGTRVSEGRGTALPFEQIGAPYIRAEELADALNELTLPGVRFTPAWFKPTFSKYAGERCEGVRLHLSAPEAIRGFSMGLYLIETLRRLYPAAFDWSMWGERNGFEQLTATTHIRAALERGQPASEIAAWAETQAETFDARADWLYA